MNKEQEEKIIAFIEKKRAEGKLDMNAILGIIKEVERKTILNFYSELSAELSGKKKNYE